METKLINVIIMVSFTMATVSMAAVGSDCPIECDCADLTVTCKDKSLDKIPSGIPHNTRVLRILNTRVNELNASDFKFLVNLTSLIATNNRIMKIHVGVFKNNHNLKTLDLSYNILSNFAADVSKGLSFLKELYLSNNKLSHIPDLGYAVSLEKLFLDKNEITNVIFPDGYLKLKNLTEIMLDDNEFIHYVGLEDLANLITSKVARMSVKNCGISSFPYGTFSPLQDLRYLSVAHNVVFVSESSDITAFLRGLIGTHIQELDMSGVFQGLPFLPPNAFASLLQTPLLKLSLAHSDIRVLKGECFGGLPDLIHLNLSYVKITTLRADAFSSLKKLEVLDLSYNRFETLEDVFHFDSLKYLNLSHNLDLFQFPDIPSSVIEIRADHCSITKLKTIGMMRSIQILDLSYNQIFGDDFDGFQNSAATELASLFVKGNPLVLMDKNPLDFWDAATSLVTVDMSQCQLEFLSNAFFHPLTKLKVLKLNNNYLGPQLSEDYNGTTFEGLRNLTELHLEDNELTNLPGDLFKELKQLERLFLKHNQLDHWEPGLFQPLTNIRLTDLSFNRILVVNETSLFYVKPEMKVNFSENPFSCGCDLVWFRNWVSQNNDSLLDLSTYVCESPILMQGVPLIRFRPSSIWMSCHWLELLYICVGIAFLLTTIFGGVVYRYRWKLMVQYYFARRYVRMMQKMTECTTEGDGDLLFTPTPDYDAILSADDNDIDFVENFLLPNICIRFEEDGAVGVRHNICYPKCDIEWGQSNSQFAEMAQPNKSNKMIIVLSENYMQSPSKADFELCVGRHRRREEGRHAIIIIFVGTPEIYTKAPADIRMLLNDQQTVKWNPQWQDYPAKYQDAMQVFYERVKDLLDKPGAYNFPQQIQT